MDITRVEIDVRKHYASGRLLQGRPILDADANHAAALFEAERRHTNVEMVGAYGSPDQGFRVGGQATTAGQADFTLDPGTLYLGGLRLTIEPGAGGQGVQFTAQTDWLSQAAQDRPAAGSGARRDLVVLEAWEQDVTAVEDGEMIDPALGVDTSAWRRRMSRAHLVADVGTDSCTAAFAAFGAGLGTLGPDRGLETGTTLTATFNDAQSAGDLCDPPIAGGYLGAENQAIRVELLDGNSLVWAYDNGAPLYRVSIDATGQVLTLDAPPRDQVHWPVLNQTVEVIAWSALLPNGETLAAIRGPMPGAAGAAPTAYFTTVAQGYDPAGRTIGIRDAPPAGFNAAWQGRFSTKLDDAQAGRRAYVRVWWRGDDVSALPIGYTPGTPVALGNTGVSVTIDGGNRRPGEHWTIAVRPKTPDRLYPWQLATGRPADGPRLYYAPLGLLAWDGTMPPHDCRPGFAPLVDAGGCCEVTLKPGEDWQGRIREALAAGDVSLCFEPGVFEATGTIGFDSHAVKITGAGAGATTIVGAALECVLFFNRCSVVISDVSVRAGRADSSLAPGFASLQGAVTCAGCGEVQIERVTFACADGDLRGASCLYLNKPVSPVPFPNNPGNPFDWHVRHSRFEVGHFQVGVLAVNADRLVVEDNLVVTRPAVLPITPAQLPLRKGLVGRLTKHLVASMTITNTAAPQTRRQRARQKQVQARAARHRERPVHAAVVRGTGAAARMNLLEAGRAHVNMRFGDLHLSFLSSDKLGDAWGEALTAARIGADSPPARIHAAVHQIAHNALTAPDRVAPAFRNWVAAVLPQLFSVSSQGIVVGGDVAGDVRIHGNTIVGTMQGVHVGLNNSKSQPHVELFAGRLQVTANTIHLRLTPESTGDRHGIYVGNVISGTVSDNHIDIISNQSGKPIQAVVVSGRFGPLVLVERNAMSGFTQGVYTNHQSDLPRGVLWKVAENVSSSPHAIQANIFRVADNVP